jgi:hypothetical protein
MIRCWFIPIVLEGKPLCEMRDCKLRMFVDNGSVTHHACCHHVRPFTLQEKNAVKQLTRAWGNDIET